jgi:hypothetical protein
MPPRRTGHRYPRLPEGDSHRKGRSGIQRQTQREAVASNLVAMETKTGMNTGDWIAAVQHGVEAVAVVVGGLWAYWKFVRGRIFHRRAELDLAPELIADGEPRAVRVRVTMKNTGAANIPVRGAEVTLAQFVGDGWERVGEARIFSDHEWVESQETISDEILIPISHPIDTYALRVRCLVITTKRKLLPHREPKGWTRNRSTGWTRNVILPGKLSVTPQATKGELPVSEREGEYQKKVEEEEAKRIEQSPDREEKQRVVTEEEAQKIEKKD